MLSRRCSSTGAPHADDATAQHDMAARHDTRQKRFLRLHCSMTTASLRAMYTCLSHMPVTQGAQFDQPCSVHAHCASQPHMVGQAVDVHKHSNVLSIVRAHQLRPCCRAASRKCHIIIDSNLLRLANAHHSAVGLQQAGGNASGVNLAVQLALLWLQHAAEAAAHTNKCVGICTQTVLQTADAYIAAHMHCSALLSSCSRVTGDSKANGSI